MAASKQVDDSLHAPLLGSYLDNRSTFSFANGTQEDEAFLPADYNFHRSHSTPASPRPGSLTSSGNHFAFSKGEPLESEAEHLVAGNKNPFQHIQDAHMLNSRGHSRHPSDREHQATSHPRPGVSSRRLRNPIEKKSFVVRAAHNAKTNPKNFFYTVLQGVVLWPKWSWAAVSQNTSLTILSLKQGFVAGLASILCIIPFPDPFDEINSIALWAVVTTDLLYESNIGLSVSKGLNRVVGTLAAGLIAMALNQIGPIMGYHIYPYFVVFTVVVGGAILRFLKGVPPLKDQWGYAFTVATIAFHLFIITAYTQPERWTLPMLRFSMILLGFFMSTLVNLAIKPIYAGDALHKLVAKNFETAASVIERCVEEYINDTKLDHVPDILSGLSVDDKIHQSYHEVVMSDSDIDKLLSAVHWEPCHGPFFVGYPWDRYDDITDYLRYTLYDVIALDSCLRANIQAPKHLRELFAKDMDTIAKECANVLRMLGDSMKNMKKFASKDIMRQAQEAAVLLQYKIYLHTHLLLGSGALESPRYPVYMASLSPFSNTQPREVPQAHSALARSGTRGQYYSKSEDGKVNENNGGETLLGEMDEHAAHDSSPGVQYGPIETEKHDASLSTKFGSPGRPVMIDTFSQGTSKTLNKSRLTQLKSRQTPVQMQHEGSPGVVISIPDEQFSRSSSSRETPELEERPVRGKSPGGANRSVRWEEQFMQRWASLGRNWDGTLERISALSLVKFASLLIEVVSKLNFVVESVEELSEQARFKEIASE